MVIDSGIGMSPNQIAEVFKPFTQANGSASRTHGGSGLGLTICERLTEMLGGTLEVESELGKGTTFRLDLPVQVVDRAHLTPEDGNRSTT